MRRFSSFFVVFVAFWSLSSFRQTTQVDGWVYEQEKKGIKVFTKKGRWGHLRDAKAIMTVASTPEQILAVLTDFEHYNTWMPRCKKSRVLARLNDHEFIVHMVFEAPWPVKDRDCVVRIKVLKDAKTGVITITETSEPKYIKEDDDMVRIQQLVSVWKLTPKGAGTEVVNEYASNPGGNIPDWMVNTQSVENPMVTFEGLQQKASLRK